MYLVFTYITTKKPKEKIVLFLEYYKNSEILKFFNILYF